MENLFYSVIATVIVSLISFVGVLGLAIKYEILNKITLWLVAISAGSLIGGAFLHLIPEALHEVEHEGSGDGEKVFLFILIGFAIFFILERILHWHHCHKQVGHCKIHTFGYMNLIGDGLHNFIDGVLIVSAFSLNFELGIATTIGVITHEIPQEISDFGVLIHSGFTKGRALFLNFLSGTLAIAGALLGFLIVNKVDNIIPWLVAITAGGFIYISASDLIPELHKEPKLSKSIISLLFFFLGISLMYFLKISHTH